MFSRGDNLRLHAWNLLQNLFDIHLYGVGKSPELQQLEEKGACSDHCSHVSRWAEQSSGVSTSKPGFSNSAVLVDHRRQIC